MRSIKRTLVLIMALAVVSVAAPAQADIVWQQDFVISPISGGTSGELAFVIGVTGNTNLEVFGKWGSLPTCDEDCVSEAVNLGGTATSGTLWALDWDSLVNWHLEFILVKDGSAGIPGTNLQLYSLFAVTDAQEQAGDGNIFVHSGTCTDGTQTGGNCKNISHFTVFGEQNGTTVPEPTTLILLGTGLVGLALAARRKIGR